MLNLAGRNEALLINFHIWLLTIGPKLDFCRIFEYFGFTVFCTLYAFFEKSQFQLLSLSGQLCLLELTPETHLLYSYTRHQGVLEKW